LAQFVGHKKAQKGLGVAAEISRAPIGATHALSGALDFLCLFVAIAGAKKHPDSGFDVPIWNFNPVCLGSASARLPRRSLWRRRDSCLPAEALGRRRVQRLKPPAKINF
jgi:hypothetical protein